MTWLNKILRSEDSHRPTAAAQRIVPAVKPAADPQQLRQRLVLAASAEECAQMEHELGAALAQLRQVPQPDDSARVRGQAVMLLTDKPDALSWLAELADEDVLVEVALHARFAEVRLSAARRLASSAALERVAQASRDKDKGVYRHCSTLLHERQAASDCAVRAAALERELEMLLAEDPVAASRLVDLEKEFQQLAGIDPRRCTELMAQFRLRVHEQAHQLQLVHARHLAAQALAAELELPAALSTEQWQQLQSRWRELVGAEAWPAWLAKHKEAVALTHLQDAIETRLATVGEDLQRLQRCEDFLASHEHDEAIGEELIAAWDALDKPDHPQLQADLQARWEACLKRHARPAVAAPVPPASLQPSAAPAARDNTLLLQLIGQMAEAIEQGHLAQAGKLDAQIVKIEAASGLPRAQAQRLVGLRAQLLKLRGWARWGSDQARQQLILQAEQLAQENQDVDSLAKAITRLRQEWKSLDVHGASNKALWAQFDAAVEKAYVPVAAHRAELAAKLQAARLAKQALCLEWENWLVQIVWEHADIKVIQTMRQEICDAWRGVGATRERRSLHKRFEVILAGLDANIEAARRQEISRCEALIVSAEGLRQETRLRQAIEGIKALQQRWRDEALSVRLARAEQEQLWRRFRSACDAVFARRAEEKTQQTAQRAQQREAAQLRLAELQAALSNQEIGQVQQSIAEFRAAWREDRAMSAPAREALQRAEAHLQTLQTSKRQAPYQLLAQKIALIEQVESAAAAGADVAVQLSEAQETWKTLPRLSAKLEQPLARRLAAAPGATATGLAEGGKLREGLLSDLEIALGLRSDAHNESRRNRNLQLLQQKFRRDQPPPVDLDKLVADWHAAAAAPDALQQQRMALILQTMGKGLLNTGL